MNGDTREEGKLQQGQTMRQMPMYQCHKKVYALKIATIELDATVASREGRETDGGAALTPTEEGYAPFKVDRDYVWRHKPQVGGYYVVYMPDGYISWSPAKAFEDGYTLLP